ncbi:MAG: SWIM zinc finger family protein [Bacilli bacterium]|nr:SWIM zinc finger family protein [Bacilli bacterium]
MATRYLIIKHLSLGYGVLLKRENNDSGKIYFADSASSKTVVLSHPYLSVAEKISLNKFVSLGLYEGLFDEDTKRRAKEYIDSRIKNMHLSENECYGAIIGTHEYSFRITIDNNSFITLSCTCPVEGACKHLYAVFVNIKKLIDPKANESKQLSISADNEFKSALERYLYVRGADNLSLISKFNYQIRSYEKARLFIETLYPFYQRGQYKARIINDILSPLYFNKYNQDNFNKILEDTSDDIKGMLNEAETYFNNTLYKDYERKNSDTKKSNLYNILLKPDSEGLVKLLKHAEDNYSEERIASQVMVEFIKYQDLTIEEIASLKSCYIFQMNHRFYMSDLLNSPMKNRLSSYLLFFDELPLDENKIKQIPLEYFLKVSSFSNDKSHYVQIAHAYYDQIKQDDIPLLAELLVGVSLQHDYIDERTIRLTIELSKKIPNATYIQELVENNIRRPKKAKAH